MAAAQPPTDTPPASPEYKDPVDRDPDEPVDVDVNEDVDRDSSTMPELEDPEGELAALEDRSAPVERTLWAINREGQRVERVYVQQGLSWFGKLELYGLLGSAVKVVLEGDNPLGVSSLVDVAQNPRRMISDLMGGMPGADTAPGAEGEEEPDLDLEAGKILAAFAQIVQLAPDLLAQAYCVALAIPKTHRPWAIEWAFPNMDDEMGKDILHTFIDQNWGVMEDFFVQELPKIMKRIVKARRGSAGPR